MNGNMSNNAINETNESNGREKTEPSNGSLQTSSATNHSLSTTTEESRHTETTNRANLYMAAAKALLERVPLIDGHNDWPFVIRGYYHNNINDPSCSLDSLPLGHTDISRLRKGKLGGQFWSAFVQCPTREDDFSNETTLPALHTTLQQIDLIHEIIKKRPQDLVLVDKADDILPAFRSGRIASMIGIEGLHQIANSASVLRMLYRLGVRYATLTHNSNTKYSDSAFPPTEPHGGLSEEGISIVHEMNRIGISLISTSYALTPHQRNVRDDVLHMLHDNGGVIMISFVPSFIKPSDGSRATVSTVADHIVYAGQTIGYDHVGIGSDFDGIIDCLPGLVDVMDYPNLIAELMSRGVSDADVEAVCGWNLIRVMREVERVARTAEEQKESILIDPDQGDWTNVEKDAIRIKGERRMKEAPY